MTLEFGTDLKGSKVGLEMEAVNATKVFLAPNGVANRELLVYSCESANAEDQ